MHAADVTIGLILQYSATTFDRALNNASSSTHQCRRRFKACVRALLTTDILNIRWSLTDLTDCNSTSLHHFCHHSLHRDGQWSPSATVQPPPGHASSHGRTTTSVIEECCRPRVWNSLPPHLRRDINFARFKRQLKTFLFGRELVNHGALWFVICLLFAP